MTNGKGEGTLPTHGARILPSVEVDSYNLEIEDDEGFIGDKASKVAFRRHARRGESGPAEGR